MQTRYTTKIYDGSKKISSTKIEDLKKILHLSPSSINSQAWLFLFVSDNETRLQLSKISKHNTDKVLNCDTVIVFSRINNIQLFEERIKHELPKGAIDYYMAFIKPQTEEQIKAWFDRQVYIALGVLLSACAEMGIDATPMEGIEPMEYNKILNQTDYNTLVAVAIGYRDIEDPNQPKKKEKARRSIQEVISFI